MLIPGSENKKIIYLLIKITRINSIELVEGIDDHFVNGLSVSECAVKYNVDRSNLYRMKRRIEMIDNYYDQIMRIKCGL